MPGNYVVLLQRTISEGGPRAAAERSGWRALRFGAARLVVALALVPAGCARDGPPEDGVRPIPGAGRPFPDLSAVPERPRIGDGAERRRMMEKLRSDREEAEKIRERNERSSATGPAAAPGRKGDDGP